MKLHSLIAGVLAISASALQAQQPDRVAPATAANPAEVRFNLSIDSMPVDDLPAVLSKALGHQVNLIVPPDAGHITLPPLKLHEVTIPELFEALEIASSPSGVSEPLYTFQATTGNVWIFKVLQPAPLAVGPVVTTSQVFPLEPYLKNLKVEDITTAIQTVAEMTAGAEGRPNLKYHEETKLLIASGSPMVLRSIESVLTALATSVQSQKEKSVMGELEAARAEMQSERLTSHLKIEALESENGSLRERMRALEAKNTELERELVRAQAALDLAAEKARDKARDTFRSQ